MQDRVLAIFVAHQTPIIMAQSNKNIARTFGMYYGLFSIVLVIIQYVTGDFTVQSDPGETNWFYTLLSLVGGVAFPIFALIKIKQANDGYLSFGKGFKSSFTVFIISALFVAVWMLIYTLVLEPGYQEALMDNTYSQMQAQGGGMTEEQMDTAMQWTQSMTSPWMLALWAILTSAILGAIASLIYSAILQAKPPVGHE
mgnify:CR=1 FL=1